MLVGSLGTPRDSARMVEMRLWHSQGLHRSPRLLERGSWQGGVRRARESDLLTTSADLVKRSVPADQNAPLASTRAILASDIAPSRNNRAGLAAFKSSVDVHGHYLNPWLH